MKTPKAFYNDGFGWTCKKCESEQKRKEDRSSEEKARLMREGEAETRSPEFSNPALAKWADKERQTLICSRCGITEPILPGQK